MCEYSLKKLESAANFIEHCAIESVEDRSRSGRLTVINQENVDQVNDFLQSSLRSSV